jgi:hypothetical protein
MGHYNKPDYHAAILTTDGHVRRRALEVVIRGRDVFAFEPRKGETTKATYHESGPRYFRIRSTKPLRELDDVPPHQITGERLLYPPVYLDQVPPLLDHGVQKYDIATVIDLRFFPPGMRVLRVSVGRNFSISGERPRYGEGEIVYMEGLLREGSPRIYFRVSIKPWPRLNNRWAA